MRATSDSLRAKRYDLGRGWDPHSVEAESRPTLTATSADSPWSVSSAEAMAWHRSMWKLTVSDCESHEYTQTFTGTTCPRFRPVSAKIAGAQTDSIGPGPNVAAASRS